MAKLNTLFPHSGSDTTLGRISKAFKDIDSRIDEVSATSTTPGNATTSEPGLMSATDKTKLDGLQNYTLPEATADVLGGVKVGTGLTIQDGKLSTVPMSKIAYIEDPAGDTVTKAEFIALRNALVAAGYMAANA